MAISENYLLTSMQRSIWRAASLWPQSPMFNIGGYARISLPLDAHRFQQALSYFLAENENFWLQVHEDHKGEPYQYISLNRELNFQLLDFSHEPVDAAEKWMKENHAIPFPLEERLFQMALLRITDSHWLWYAKLHHLIADGYTLSLLFNGVMEKYSSLESGHTIAAAPRNSFISSIHNTSAYYQSETSKTDYQFWKEVIPKLPSPIPLSSIGKVGPFLPQSTSRKTWTIPKKDWDNMESVATQMGCHVYSFLLAVVYSLFGRIFQSKFSLGIPLLIRSERSTKKTAGMLTAPLPFWFDDNLINSFAYTMKQLHSQLRLIYRHRKWHGEDLLSLHPNEGEMLYNTVFSYQKIDYHLDPFNDSIEIEFMRPQEQLEDLVIHVLDYHHDKDRRLQIDFRPNCIKENIISTLGNTFLHLCQNLPSNPEITIKDIPLIKNPNTPKKKTNKEAKSVVEYFQIQAQKEKEKIAIQTSEGHFSYLEIENKAKSIAHFLKQQGVSKGDIVGIIASPDMQYIPAMIAVFSCRAILLPIDPTLPRERIHFMLSDSQASICLNASSITIPHAVSIKEVLIAKGHSNLRYPTPNDPAYVIYTSGTTGKPKGVLISHKSLSSYCTWALRAYGENKPISCGFFSSISFDFTFTSILLPLISGGSITIPPAGLPNQQILSLIHSNITHLKLTPAHLEWICEQPITLTNPIKFIIGGDILPAQLIAKAKQNIHGKWRVYNEYGPTECTIGCIMHPLGLAFSEEEVPIGKPSPHTEIILLDSQLNQVPHGLPGEICIGGDGIAIGYLNRPELNASRFISHPYRPKEYLYRSGDFARYDQNGDLLYLGRQDRQLKVKGHRIEAQEIERLILECNGVEAVYVGFSHKILTAWIQGSVDYFALRQHLVEHLPSTVIPAQMQLVDRLPITSHGKVDVDQLIKINPSRPENLDPNSVSAETQEIITQEISRVLNKQNIDPHDNFFVLGGDSIKAMQLASRLIARGFSIRTADVFAFPSVIELIQLCQRQHIQVIDNSKTLLSFTAKRDLLPSERWFLNLALSRPNFYHQSVWIQWKNAIAPDLLETCFQKLLQRHPTLYLKIDLADKSVFYKPSSKIFKLEAHQEAPLEYYKQGWNLKEDLLIKVILFPQNRIFITAHHLLVDKISWNILLEDLDTIYDAICVEKNLPEFTSQINPDQWITHLKQKPLSKSLEWWQEIEESPPAFHPSSGPLTPYLKFNLNKEETQILMKAASHHPRFGVLGILLTTIRLLSQPIDHDFLKIRLETHGRNVGDIDWMKTIGWFTCHYPQLLKTQKTDFKNAIHEVIGILAIDPMDYARLQLDDDDSKKNSGSGTVDLCINYLGNWSGEVNFQHFTYTEDDIGQETDMDNRFDYASEIRARISLECFYLEMLLDTTREDILIWDSMVLNFKETLIKIADYLNENPAILITPENFDVVKLEQQDFDTLFK